MQLIVYLKKSLMRPVKLWTLVTFSSLSNLLCSTSTLAKMFYCLIRLRQWHMFFFSKVNIFIWLLQCLNERHVPILPEISFTKNIYQTIEDYANPIPDLYIPSTTILSGDCTTYMRKTWCDWVLFLFPIEEKRQKSVQGWGSYLERGFQKAWNISILIFLILQKKGTKLFL